MDVLDRNRTVGIGVIAALLSIPANRCAAQAAPSLPAPSGKSVVGRTSFHWVDTGRPEPATEAPDDKREIVVQVWYPAAKKGSNTGSYMPGLQRLASSPAAGALSNLFGPAWPAIASSQLRTHSFDGALVAVGSKLPILVFSAGGGVPVFAYTAQIEDLASHGYMVVGVDHTYESPGVVFPDGRVITAADDYLERLRRQSANAEDFEKLLTDRRAEDLRFVLNKLFALNEDAKSIFHQRLDLAHVGVLGHSRGGRSAVRACQLDARFRACLNQDGSWSWHPFWLDAGGRSLNQPFMMLDHFDPDPPAEVFRKMGTTREKYVERRSARQAEAREKLYRTVAAGSYHVSIRTPGVSHNSFLDIRQLGRADGSGINAWPEDIRAVTPNAAILSAIAAWTRAFFDENLRGRSESIANQARESRPEVEVRRYSPR